MWADSGVHGIRKIFSLQLLFLLASFDVGRLYRFLLYASKMC